MKYPEPICDRIEEAIDRYFTSTRTDAEKLQGANDLLKGLASYNRRIAEARGLGRDAMPSPRMPPEVIHALDTGKYEIVEAWYETKWYLSVTLPAGE